MVIPLEGNERPHRRYQSTYQRVVCWWSTFHVPSLEVTKTVLEKRFSWNSFAISVHHFQFLLN